MQELNSKDLWTMLGGSGTNDTITLKDTDMSDMDNDMDDLPIEEDEPALQLTIEEYLQDFSRNPSKEILLPMSLSGTIDFSIVKNMSVIEKIVFEKPGQVTKLLNLPKQLLELNCCQQKLTELQELPATLKILKISENDLVILDLKQTPHLIQCDVNDNFLKSILNIPISLKELYCDGNQLESLDLTGVPLQKLHISYNNTDQKIVITGLPTQTLQDFQIEETLYEENSTTPKQDLQSLLNENPKKNRNPQKKKNKSPPQQHVSLEEAIKTYYQWQHRYRIKNKEKKSQEIVCISCKKKGGMIFETRDKKMIACCGNTNDPCSFYIEIYKGDYTNFATYQSELETKSLKCKQDIIDLNYKVSHGMLTDARELEEKLQTLTEMESILSTVNTIKDEQQKQRDEGIMKNKQNADRYLHDIQILYQNYLKEKNNVLLNELVKRQLSGLNPCLSALHRWQYWSLITQAEELKYTPDDFDMSLYDENCFIRDYPLSQDEPQVIHYHLSAT